ncbi:methyltransferase [Micromonospora wenchangensis]
MDHLDRPREAGDAPYTLPAAPQWIAEGWSCSGQHTRPRLGTVRSKVAKSGPGPGGCAGPRPTRTFRVGRRSPLGDRPGNFFDEVPAGGDIHALQYILHDWDDDRCVRIPTRLPAGQEHPDGRGGWHWTPSCPRVTAPIRARASTWSSWPRSPAGSEPGRSSPPCSTRPASG